MKKRVLQVIQGILVIIILVCGYQIANYFLQRKHSDDQFSAVQSTVEEIRAVPSTDGAPKEKKTINFTEMMARLQKVNRDIVGYLDIEGTPAQYPIVYSGDNDYYLYRGLDEEWSVQGTPFLDEKNATDLSDRNTIVYAHMMFTGETMFSSLRHFLEQDYVDQSPKRFTVTNAEGVHHYRMFAAFRVSADEDYRTPNPGDEEWIAFLQNSYQRSTTYFGEMPDFQPTDRVMTFSTCTPEHDDSLRVAVLGLYEYTETADGEKK